MLYSCEKKPNLDRCYWIYFCLSLLSIVFIVIALIVFSVQPPQQCGNDCQTKSCEGVNGQSYPCTCGNECEDKQNTSSDNTFVAVGSVFIILGIIMLIWSARRLRVLNAAIQQNAEQAILVVVPSSSSSGV
mmetsp:Transcript_12683/g.19051  ORF Transcript_12683/g.19051 Transcript_12683/m.19051 type:complete len:131 (-) Transcript_12683:93-485(-)